MRTWYRGDWIDGICLLVACVLTAVAFLVVYMNTSSSKQTQEWHYNLAQEPEGSGQVAIEK